MPEGSNRGDLNECLRFSYAVIGLTHNGFELGSQRDVLDLTFGGYFKRIIVVEPYGPSLRSGFRSLR